MSTGEWLAKIGRAITRQETFERTIAPAIADMQMEAPSGRLLQLRHYSGILLVLMHALSHDLRLELIFAFDAESRRTAWKRAALWYVGSVALLTGLGWRYTLPPNLSLRQLWLPALTSTGLEAIISAVIPATLAASLYLTRKSCSRRSVVLVALMVAMLTTAFAMSVRPVRMSADRALLYSRGIFSPNPYEDGFDQRVLWWRDIRSGVQVIPFVLLGMLLARRKGWHVAHGLAAYFASWLLLVVVLLSTLPVSLAPSRIVQIWQQIALNFLALILLFLVDRVSSRFHSKLT